MPVQSDAEKTASLLLKGQGLKLVSCRPIQTLWGGYGKICALKAVSATGSSKDLVSLILKYVSPPSTSDRRQDEGHLRKVIYNEVEQYFYANLATLMPQDVAVASCLASTDAHGPTSSVTAMILSDLRQNFSVPGESCRRLSKRQVHAAIDWLAGFHGFWWSRVRDFPREELRRPPLEEVQRSLNGSPNATRAQGGVWLNGGYTYLATRMTEYADLTADDTSEWSSKLCRPLDSDGKDGVAEVVARFLSPSIDQKTAASEYETVIHGDVKSENFFVDAENDAVAFFDFQYVGLGLGVCDLAKLFTCSVPEKLLYSDDGTLDQMHASEEKLLRRYLEKLEIASGKQYDWDTFVRHWETALVDWLRFQASWGFWGNTEWLEAKVRSILKDDGWRTWLRQSM